MDIVVADLDGDDAGDLVLNYDFGVHKYIKGNLSRITESTADGINVSPKDVLGKQDVVLDYSFGLHRYSDGTLSKISSSSFNSRTREQAFGTNDYTDIIYTATYGAFGELIDKKYFKAIVVLTEDSRIEVKRVADEDGAKAYRYEYYSDTDIVKARYAYSYADLSDGSDPKLVGYLYTDHFDATGAFTERTREINLYSLQNVDRWFPIRAADTAAVREVIFPENANYMEAEVDLRGDPTRPHLRQAEVALDLMYGEVMMPDGGILSSYLDMAGGTFRVELELPEGIEGTEEAPTGIQLAVKGDNNASQYGKWHNVPAGGGTMVVEFSPGYEGTEEMYTTDNFDPEKVNLLVVKAALNSSVAEGFEYKGKIKIKKVELQARTRDLKSGSSEISVMDDAVVTENRREAPSETAKPSLTEFLNWSGISEYSEPGMYGSEMLTSDGFDGFTGSLVRNQYEDLEKVKDKIKNYFTDVGDFNFTDRRFLFCDLAKGLVKGADGSLSIDHEIARKNIEALLDICREYDMKLIPVLFDYRMFITHAEFGLYEEEMDKLIDLVRPEIRLLGENSDVVKAIEPVNEPDVDTNGAEYHLVTGVDPFTGESTHVPLSMRQKFVEKCADAIREETSLPVSFSSVSREATKYWLHLLREGDILNFHYYTKGSYTEPEVIDERGLELGSAERGWMDNIPEGVKVIIGEYQPSTGDKAPLVKDLLPRIRDLGYDGGLYWNVEKDFQVEGSDLIEGLARMIEAENVSEPRRLRGGASPGLVINEVVYGGSQAMPDEDGIEDQDWIEIYNSGIYGIDLDGVYLTDDDDNMYKWALPDITLGSGEYLVVYASGKNRNEPSGNLHTNFRLQKGEPVMLVSVGSGLLDQMTSEQSMAALEDHSIGRLPDGSGEFASLPVAGPGLPNMDPANALPGIVINEIMSNNDTTVEFPYGSGQYPDWIELYNPFSVPADIKNYKIFGDNNAWEFTGSTVIPAGGYLVVYANNADVQNPPQTDFGLSSSGETITLEDNLGNVIDTVVCPALVGDESYGRVPDGSTALEYISASPTPGSGNRGSSAPLNPDAEYIVINEVVTSNGDTLSDYQGDSGDWIELFNVSSTVSVNMKGMVIGDSGSKWQFPDDVDVIVPPRGRLMVFADGKNTLVNRGGGYYEAHTNFGLGSDGDKVTLYNTDWGTVVDTVTVPGVPRDHSYGRYPDGSDIFREMPEATPMAVNEFTQIALNNDAFSLVVNEIVTNNVTGLTDEDGDHVEWVEIYNSGSAMVDLEGLRLCGDSYVWEFPSGQFIAPGEYRIVFLSGKGRDRGELHTRFSLSALNGGTLQLVNRNNPDFTVIDYINVPPLGEDMAYARVPDSSGEMGVVSRSTPGAANFSGTGELYQTYDSGRVKSVTYDPAQDGILYIEYLDENWEDGHGRVVRQINASPDEFGVFAYEYVYSVGADYMTVQYGYTNTDFTDPFYVATFDGAGNLIDRDFIEGSYPHQDGVNGRLRYIDQDTGDITEYTQIGGIDVVVLFYDASESNYRTYNWTTAHGGTYRVRVEEYQGTYSVTRESDVWADVVENERCVASVYSHDGINYWDLDTRTNDWDLLDRKEYAPGGMDIAHHYQYDPGGRLMRYLDNTAGDVTEYVRINREDVVSLFYDASENTYRTYDWTLSHDGSGYRVTVEEYSGVYSVPEGSSLWYDVILGERVSSEVYAHDGSDFSDLDPLTNGWTLIGNTEYSPGGTLVSSYSQYDPDGNLMRTVDGGTGDITEYTRFNGEDAVALFFDQSESVYRTYEWDNLYDGECRVTVEEYRGTYSSPEGTPLWYDIRESEKSGTSEYRYEGADYSDPDTATNYWVPLSRTEYYPGDTGGTVRYEYDDAGKLLRRIDDITGDITEYVSINGEDVMTLYYDAREGAYKTYNWTMSQVGGGPVQYGVVVEEYDGTYSAAAGASVLSGVSPGDRVSSYTYDHDGMNYQNLDSGSNGWILRETREYYPGGGTVYIRYQYDIDGRVYRGTLNASDGTADIMETYEYHEPSGKLAKKITHERDPYDGSPASYLKAPYTVYTYYDDANNRMKRKINVGKEDNASYQYYNDTANRMEFKWESDGSVYHYTNEDYYGQGYGLWDAGVNAAHTELYLPGGYNEPGFAGTNTPRYGHVYNLRSGTDNAWDYSLTYVFDPYWVCTATLTDPAEAGYPAPVITADIPGAPVVSDPASLNMDLSENTYVSRDDIVGSGYPESFGGNYDTIIRRGSSGEGIKVAVLDSLTEHGEITSSIVSGTAPGADVLEIETLDGNGDTTSAKVADAIKTAVECGSRVIAMPFSLFPLYDTVEKAIDEAVENGVLLIASAGNEGGEIMQDSLAGNNKVVTVGSVDNDGKLSAWSNYGEEVDLYAPWDVIEIAASPSAPRNDARPGTSFSAAFVAGIAALVLEDNPDMTAGEVLAELREILAPIQVEAKVEAEKEVKGEDV
ncbi:MAG: S8 family serine peptidase, partial [Candidatus Omnitrophica bacterium]|nr:S8 family serine peptidase [Candidatus Omnitrophota bacterium]